MSGCNNQNGYITIEGLQQETEPPVKTQKYNALKAYLTKDDADSLVKLCEALGIKNRKPNVPNLTILLRYIARKVKNEGVVIIQNQKRGV